MAGEPGDRWFAARKSGGREESPDSIVVNSQEPSTKGNAPGNARGLRIWETRRRLPETRLRKVPQKIKPPVSLALRWQVLGKTGDWPV
jgi:hypothetical protein